LECLQESLQALLCQQQADGTNPLSAIYVIDNASTDGTAAWLLQRQTEHDAVAIHHHRLPTNTGGAGGFAAGLEIAFQAGHTWIWLLDDDAWPEANALAALHSAAGRCPSEYPPRLLASKVVWRDGSCHVLNRVAPHYVGREDDFSDMVQAGFVPIRAASFVSVMIHREAVARLGLPLTSYQLWSDDIEYTARIARHFTAIYVPQSVVLHATPANAGTLDAPPARIRFYVRNHGWMLLWSAAYSRQEKLKIWVAYMATIARLVFRRPHFLSRCWYALRGGVALLTSKPVPARMLTEVSSPIDSKRH
jgi:GT2 family glycosyltransferase